MATVTSGVATFSTAEFIGLFDVDLAADSVSVTPGAGPNDRNITLTVSAGSASDTVDDGAVLAGFGAPFNDGTYRVDTVTINTETVDVTAVKV